MSLFLLISLGISPHWAWSNGTSHAGVSNNAVQVNRNFTRISTDSQDLGKSTQQKNTIELEGVVIETLPSAVFRVQIESGQVILAHLSGKMRVNRIRILPGDKVIIEVTPYDLTRGRVVRRLR
jgi:translation initiation factor IF-1